VRFCEQQTKSFVLLALCLAALVGTAAAVSASANHILGAYRVKSARACAARCML
jgi:hypothetical protein